MAAHALSKQRIEDDDLSVQVANLAAAVRMLIAEVARDGDAGARLLKPAELGKLWGYSPARIYALIKDGKIPTVPAIEDGTYRVPLVWARSVILKALEGQPSVDPELVERLLKGEE